MVRNNQGNRQHALPSHACPLLTGGSLEDYLQIFANDVEVEGSFTENVTGWTESPRSAATVVIEKTACFGVASRFLFVRRCCRWCSMGTIT